MSCVDAIASIEWSAFGAGARFFCVLRFVVVEHEDVGGLGMDESH